MLAIGFPLISPEINKIVPPFRTMVGIDLAETSKSFVFVYTFGSSVEIGSSLCQLYGPNTAIYYKTKTVYFRNQPASSTPTHDYYNNVGTNIRKSDRVVLLD